MRRTFTVAGATLRVLFRQGGGGYALLALTAMITLFIFYVSGSDGILEHELRIRVRYGLQFGVTAFSLALLWMSCVSMRGDIDAKRIHLLTSYPLKRSHIFLGKWLGLVAFGAIGLLVALISCGVATRVMVERWPKADEVKALSTNFWAVSREVLPIEPDLADAVNDRLATINEQQGLPEDPQELAALTERIRHDMRRDRQVIPTNGARDWVFELGDLPRRRETVTLKYRFYTRSDAKDVTGTWIVGSMVTNDKSSLDVTFTPNSTVSLDVPMDVIPEDGRIWVTFTGRDNPELVAYRGSGIRLFYESGGTAGNTLRFFVFMMAHYSVLVAIGLLVSVAFTMSIATFTATVLYGLALSSTFFQRFLVEEWWTHDPTFLDNFVKVFVHFGLFFATGLEQPAVVETLSESLDIRLSNVGMYVTQDAGSLLLSPLKLFSEPTFLALNSSGLPVMLGYVLYLSLVLGAGVWLLTRKELDRVH